MPKKKNKDCDNPWGELTTKKKKKSSVTIFEIKSTDFVIKLIWKTIISQGHQSILNSVKLVDQTY